MTAGSERERELLESLCSAVIAYDTVGATKLSIRIVSEGLDARKAVQEGLAAGMERVGELYNRQEYFVPELLLCADALYAALGVLRPHIRKTGGEGDNRQIVLGTIEGDVHDIGKNLVKVMFDAAGWVVHDLGRDVPLERFVEEQKRTQAALVGVSALMTTSMRAMPHLIKMLKASAPDVLVMVGGAPVTRSAGMQYGADGYADNAGTAVQEAVRLLASSAGNKGASHE
jgi:methylmalonyl-CoA mutase cobalamin-binding domain/chain